MDACEAAAQPEARSFVGVARFVSKYNVWCGNCLVGAQAIKLFSLHIHPRAFSFAFLERERKGERET